MLYKICEVRLDIYVNHHNGGQPVATTARGPFLVELKTRQNITPLRIVVVPSQPAPQSYRITSRLRT